MSGNSRCLRACALALLFATLPFTQAFAHCFVGARFFPATLATDDPCVADEMSLPTISWSRTADTPPATEWDMSARILKTHHRGFWRFDQYTWTQIRGPGGPTMAGFDNLETAAQYQLLKDGSHELAMLLGLVVNWGSTGAINSGIATPYSVLTPTYYFGKGFGDLPDERRLAARLRGDRRRSAIRFRAVRSTWCSRRSSRRCWPGAARSSTACRI